MGRKSWEEIFSGPSGELATVAKGNANEYYNDQHCDIGIDSSINYYELIEHIYDPEGTPITGFGVTKRGSMWKVWLFNYENERLCSPEECEYGNDYDLVLDSSAPTCEAEALRQAKENFKQELA